MRIILIFLIFSTNLYTKVSLEELDYFRKISNQDSESIIENGTNFCTNYFENNTSLSNLNYKNFFMCKFSKKRNRFYIYMLAVKKGTALSLKEFCEDFLSSWPEVKDHMDKKLIFQKKKYLSGFYIENFFNKRVLSFIDNFSIDQLTIDNEINKFIIENKSLFTNDNIENNLIIEKAANKINKIYKKIINNSVSDLDILVKKNLDEIVRYKIFVNDAKNFKSYSCNWEPGKGIVPYVKRERFSEFENI